MQGLQEKSDGSNFLQSLHFSLVSLSIPPSCTETRKEVDGAGAEAWIQGRVITSSKYYWIFIIFPVIKQPPTL